MFVALICNPVKSPIVPSCAGPFVITLSAKVHPPMLPLLEDNVPLISKLPSTNSKASVLICKADLPASSSNLI